MTNLNNDNKKYNWHAGVSSEGTLALELCFPDGIKITKEQKETILAETLLRSKEFMLSKGYLMPDARFLSSSDMAKEYGHTRQYWEKLINEGKIIYKETSAGRITTDLWVRGYLNNREKVDEYIRNKNKIVKIILAGEKRSGKTTCPQCEKPEFDYFVNSNSINGLCRAGCGFRIHTTI